MQEVSQEAEGKSKITFKVTLAKKTKVVTCTDFKSLQQKSAEVFGLVKGSFEILIMDDDDELACDTQAEFGETLDYLGE